MPEKSSDHTLWFHDTKKLISVNIYILLHLLRRYESLLSKCWKNPVILMECYHGYLYNKYLNSKNKEWEKASRCHRYIVSKELLNIQIIITLDLFAISLICTHISLLSRSIYIQIFTICGILELHIITFTMLCSSSSNYLQFYKKY